MVHAIARGGQTVLSPGLERDAALGLSSDAGAAGCLQLLLERIRVAATDDLNRSFAAAAGAAAAAAAAVTAAAAPGAASSSTASSAAATAAISGSQRSDATCGAWHLSLCGDLIVRLEPPEPIDAPGAIRASRTLRAQEDICVSLDGGSCQRGNSQTENGQPSKTENRQACETENGHAFKTENVHSSETENHSASHGDHAPPPLRGLGSSAVLSSRTRAAGCWRVCPRQPYWDVHVDRHNASTYHVSAVLYLATGEEAAGGRGGVEGEETALDSGGAEAGGVAGGVAGGKKRAERADLAGLDGTASVSAYDEGLRATSATPAPSPSSGSPLLPVSPCFRGGAFSFHDGEADVVLYPEAGSLLTFSSGAENPHSVSRVEAGCRFALVAWFTQEWVGEGKGGGGALEGEEGASALHEGAERGAAAGTVGVAGQEAIGADSLAGRVAAGTEVGAEARAGARVLAGGEEPSPNADLCASLSRLALGGDESALRLAAVCCLAGNDPARGALLGRDGAGRSMVAAMERVLREEGGHGQACLPTAWVRGLGLGGSEYGAGRGAACGIADVGRREEPVPGCDELVLGCEEPVLTCEDQLAALLGPDAGDPILAALRAGVQTRLAALEAALAAARGAMAADARFDVFD
jgi:hypothetical protein